MFHIGKVDQVQLPELFFLKVYKALVFHRPQLTWEEEGEVVGGLWVASSGGQFSTPGPVSTFASPVCACGRVPGPVMAGDVGGSLQGVYDGLVEKAVDGWWVVKTEVGWDGGGMVGCVSLSLA